MVEYKTYPTTIDGIRFYECPDGFTINGVTRETLNFDGDDISSCYVEVYPTTEENIAYIICHEPMAVMYAPTTCFENVCMNINELKKFIDETFDVFIEDVESYNF